MELAMGTEYTAKSFKSGNSVAIRMPAALGVKPEREWIVSQKDGDLVLRAADAPKRKFNIAKVAGSAKSLKLIDDDARLFEERRLEWPERKA